MPSYRVVLIFLTTFVHPDYYQGAYVREHDEPRPLKGRLERLLKDFSGEEIVQELSVMGVLETRHQYRGQDENPIENLTSDLTVPQHQWFVDAFKESCSAKGIDADLTLSPVLASVLDDWLSKRLSKKSYLGNKVFYDETIPRIKDKISRIVTDWDFIEISYLGERLQVPPVPDLEFLVTNRESVFEWVREQRQRSLESILAQLETKERAALGS